MMTHPLPYFLRLGGSGVWRFRVVAGVDAAIASAMSAYAASIALARNWDAKASSLLNPMNPASCLIRLRVLSLTAIGNRFGITRFGLSAESIREVLEQLNGKGKIVVDRACVLRVDFVRTRQDVR